MENSLNPGAEVFIPYQNYLLTPPYYNHHLPLIPSSSYFYPPLPLPCYKTCSATTTTYSFPSCAAIHVFSTSTATCAPSISSSYYQSSLGSDWYESFNPYSSSTQAFLHTSRFDQISDYQSYGLTSVAEEEVDKKVVHEEKLIKPLKENDFHVVRGKKNIPPRLGGSHHNHRKQTNLKFIQKKMIWKPKSAISDNNNGAISTSDHDRVMYMILPSKKIVDETSDATTLMIRNIPSKYTREMLTNLLEDHCKEANQMEANESGEEKDKADDRLSAFDFLYLPIDFKTRCNRGYAFVNMINSSGANKLRLFLDNYKWSVYQSKKICEITDAKYQGKEALVKHFSNSYFECDSDNFLPRCFSPYRDGSGGFVEESTVGKLYVLPHHQNDDGCI